MNQVPKYFPPPEDYWTHTTLPLSTRGLLDTHHTAPLHQRTTGHTPHCPSPPEDYWTHTTLPLSTRGLLDTHHTAPLHQRTTGHTPHCPSPPENYWTHTTLPPPPEDYWTHTTLPLSTRGPPDTHHTAPLHQKTTGHTPQMLVYLYSPVRFLF